MEPEIVIAGAGVAGLTAAIYLHRAGRPVRVVDRNRGAGVQRFADWDAMENWTAAEDLPAFLARAGIDDTRFRYAGYTAFSVIDPYGRRHDVHTPRPFFYMVRRGATPGGLEAGLQAQAEAAGIPITWGTPCPPGEADIWAVGAFGQGTRFVSTGITFETDHPNWVCGLVDMRVAPRAYAYLVCIDGEGTLAVVLTEARREANRLLDRAVEVFGRHTALTMRHPHKSGGSGGDLGAFGRSRADCVIGEAAGFQDYLWGFGIRHALTSGVLAARAILEGRDWQALADAEIRPLVRASLVNRWLYDRVPRAGYAALIRHFAAAPDLNALVGRWYHPRRIHGVLWPVVAWQARRELAPTAPPARPAPRTRPRPLPGGAGPPPPPAA